MTGEPVMLSLLGFGFLCLMGLILWFCVFRMSVLSFVEWDYFWGGGVMAKRTGFATFVL